MADDLKPLLAEMKRTNAGVQKLVDQGIEDDTPKSLLAGNIFEILNAQAIFKVEKKLIGEVIEKNDESSNYLGTLVQPNSPFVEALTKFINQVRNIIFKIQNLSMKSMKLFIDQISDGTDLNLFALNNIFEQQGLLIDSADRQTDMLDDAQKSESRQEEKDKDAKLAQENRFSKLSRNFTKGIAGLGKKFDSLTEGIVGKVGLATILTFLFASFVNNYRPFAEAITKVIVALGKFFKDLGLVIDGEMNFGQFLKENLVAIAGGFLFMFRKFIITKLFGGLTRRIAASIKLIGKTAGSKIAMAGKLFLKVLARFFLLPMIIFKAITGFFDGYMKKIESGGTFFEALGAGFLGALQNVFDFLADGVMFIVDALKSLFDPIIDAITGGLKSAYNFFKKLVFGEDIEGRYMGGPVAAGSPYLVGEKGPELFVPGASGGVVANNNMGGGAPIIVNNNQVNAPTSNHSHQHSNISITDSQQEITGL